VVSPAEVKKWTPSVLTLLGLFGIKPAKKAAPKGAGREGLSKFSLNKYPKSGTGDR
jgi:hypothetical protein